MRCLKGCHRRADKFSGTVERFGQSSGCSAGLQAYLASKYYCSYLSSCCVVMERNVAMDSSKLSSDHTCYRISIGDRSDVLGGLEKEIVHWYACCMSLRHSSSGSKEIRLRLCLVIRS